MTARRFLTIIMVVLLPPLILTAAVFSAALDLSFSDAEYGQIYKVLGGKVKDLMCLLIIQLRGREVSNSKT